MSNVNPLRGKVLLEWEFIQSTCGKIFLFPFIGRTKTEKIGYIANYILVLCTAIQLSLTLFSYNTNDWLEIINVAPNLGVVCMAIIRYGKIYSYRQLYQDIYVHFRDDVWDMIEPHSLEQKQIVENYKKIIYMINRFLLYYSIPLAILVDSLPYLLTLYEEKVNGVKELLYPFDGWYPFDKTKWYFAVYIWESIMTAIVICFYSFINMIHSTFIGLICMELKILGSCLENIITPEDIFNLTSKRNVDEVHRSVLVKLKSIIKRHEFLAKISAQLDEMLGDAMLLNYSLGAVFICLTAFTFSVVDNLYKKVRYFSMCNALLVEIFSQCLLGQVLSDHSMNLTESIYFSNWIYANPEAKKIMCMFMIRTQKPFKLTANGYLTMNIETFNRICSTSYQFFNLLRTVYT